MIANISHTEKSRPFIDYNENKVKKGEAERLDFNGLSFGSSVSNLEKIFEFHCSLSKRKDKFLHISLNFAKEDMINLDKNKIIEIADEYLKGIGLPENHMRLIYQHFDTANPHIHIVTPKIIEGAKVLKDSKLFLRSQEVTRRLEKRFQLKEVSSAKKNRVVPDAIIIKDDPEVINLKSRIKNYSNAINYVLKHYSFSNLDGFNKALKEVGLKAKEVSGIHNSESWKGIVFYSLNDDAKGIKGSQIYGNVSYSRLEKKFENNLELEKDRDIRIYKYMNSVINKYIHISKDTFAKEMLKVGVEVEYIKKGGIDSAMRFYDNILNRHLKPSSLDRDYSYGNMKEMFSEKNEFNYSYLNQLKLNILLKKYTERYPDETDQHKLMFIVKHGFIPNIKDGKVSFNLNSNPNKSTSNNTRPVHFNMSKIDTAEVVELINKKTYNLQVVRNNYLLNDDVERANQIEEILMNKGDRKEHNNTFKSLSNAIGEMSDFINVYLMQFQDIDETQYYDFNPIKKKKRKKGFGYN